MTDENRLLVFPTQHQGPSQSVFTSVGSGGGGGDDMIARLIKVEADVSAIKEVLSRLEPMISSNHTTLTEIKSDLKHMPTTTTVVILLITIFLGGLAVSVSPDIIRAIKEPSQSVNVLQETKNESKRSK